TLLPGFWCLTQIPTVPGSIKTYMSEGATNRALRPPRLSLPTPAFLGSRFRRTAGEASPGMSASCRAAAGAYNCFLTVTRGSKTSATGRCFLNGGPGARGGTSPGVAAPNPLTFSAPPMTTPSGPPQTVTINADGYYATVTRTGGFPTFGSNELLSLT